MINRLTPVVKNLLFINLIIFGLNIFVGTWKENVFGDYFGLRAFNSPEFQPYQILTYMFIHAKSDPFTGEIALMHILGNMFVLFMFGPWLENLFGSQKFLAFYMITGMGAGLFNSGVNYYFLEQQKGGVERFEAYQYPGSLELVQYIGNYDTRIYENPNSSQVARDFISDFQEKEENIQKLSDSIQGIDKAINLSDRPENKENLTALKQFLTSQLDTLRYEEKVYSNTSKEIVRNRFQAYLNVPTIGASGAIFGILVAFAMIFPNMTLMLIIPPIPIQAKYLAILMIAFELYNGLGYGGATNVAHFAHLGGALIGFLLIRYWGIKRQF